MGSLVSPRPDRHGTGEDLIDLGSPRQPLGIPLRRLGADAALDEPDRWRTTRRVVGGAVGSVHSQSRRAPVAIAPADVPTALPTVLTSTAAAVDSPSGGPSMIVGLDGGIVKAHAVAQVSALPLSG